MVLDFFEFSQFLVSYRNLKLNTLGEYVKFRRDLKNTMDYVIFTKNMITKN